MTTPSPAAATVPPLPRMPSAASSVAAGAVPVASVPAAAATVSPQVTVDPSAPLGERMLAFARSLLADAGDLAATAVATVERDPEAFATHVVVGFCEAAYDQTVGLAKDAVSVAETTLRALACGDASLRVLAEEFGVWITGQNGIAVAVLDHGVRVRDELCAPLYEGYDALAAALQSARSLLRSIAEDARRLVDLADGLVGELRSVLDAGGLFAGLTAAAGDPEILGSSIGAAMATVVLTVIAPESRLLGASRWAVRGTAVLEGSEKARRLANVTRLTYRAEHSVRSSAVLEGIGSASAEARKVLRGAGVSHIDRLDTGGLQRFGDAMGRAGHRRAFEAASTLWGKAFSAVTARVTSYRELTRELRDVNALTKIVVLEEAVGVAGASEAAVRTARLQFDEVFFEAAHLIDKQWLLAGDGARDVVADMHRLGWRSPADMPCVAAPRAVHRTTLQRLRELGGSVPDVDAPTMTEAVGRRTVLGTAPREGILVVTPTTRLHELITHTARVYEEHDRSVFGRASHRLFDDYRTALRMLDDPGAVERAAAGWPAFRAWLDTAR